MVGFLIKYRIPVIILFYIFQSTWIFSGSRLMYWEEMDLLAWLSFFFLFGFWFVLLLDMIATKIYNKSFWLLAMLVLPSFAPAFYLYQRKKLHPLQTSVFNRRKNVG